MFVVQCRADASDLQGKLPSEHRHNNSPSNILVKFVHAALGVHTVLYGVIYVVQPIQLRGYLNSSMGQLITTQQMPDT